MPKNKKKFITLSMFDIRPVDGAGDLDLEKINSLEKVVKVNPKRFFPHSDKEIGDVFYDVRRPDVFEEESIRFRKMVEREEEEELKIPFPIPVWDEKTAEIEKPQFKEIEEKKETNFTNPSPEALWGLDYFEKFEDPTKKKKGNKKETGLAARIKKTKKDIWQAELFKANNYFRSGKLSWQRAFPSFAVLSMAVFFFVLVAGLLGKGLSIKNGALKGGQEAYANLLNAKNGLQGRDFQKASFEFNEAYKRFDAISKDMDTLGAIVIESSRFVPFASKLSSGAHLASAGKDISQIGIKISETLSMLDKAKESLGDEKKSGSMSLLSLFQSANNNLKEISTLTDSLQSNLEKVNIDDIPEDKREKFIELKKQLPAVNETMAEFLDDSRVFADILGGNGPRKYLFLFQNNQEMRATGGFIGTYGVLDIFNGRVRKFFVDGIFNPDGQLQEKVIPPTPIQKISAAWSLHDSNWFPDFPKSAEKASWFYEKTGGPTVDGIITMTPTVMQKLLEVTGPIEMPEYGVTVDKDNFIEKIQYEVEVDYDKELNQPKKVLADLAPKILDKIFNADSFESGSKIMKIMLDSLNEKQILIYSKNFEIEKILSQRGWSGEVLDTPKDYLSVINTNINGYKTDGVVEESIAHQAEIRDDGQIVDTVTITRHHKGGNSQFEWWNKVNADYMRVYVPKGSTLISATGQTREFNSPPLDYKMLGFKKDPQVEMEESQIQTDEETGTRIYEDSGKTVFANWVYVSPQETVEIKYSYLLPFKVEMNSENKPSDAYSLLAQKQSGSLGSKFNSKVVFPAYLKLLWTYPEEKMSNVANLAGGKKVITVEDDLKTDKFIGAAFSQE